MALSVAKRWDGASWVDIALPGGGGGLSATVSPASAHGEEPFVSVFQPVTTNLVTVTATGGAGAGPTYSWNRISGSSKISAAAPTSSSTTFEALLRYPGEITATFRCTVTRGVETVTVDVPVSCAITEL